MTDSNQLLRQYAQTGSETAFQELVSRYIDLVYSVAVRRVGGDADLARDVVQTVFIDLARKASRLRSESTLGGWLHRHTCFVSSNFRRTLQRSAAREQVAMELANQSSGAAWEQLAPMLDEVIDQLGDADRKSIVLRFYEQRDLRSVGLALGTSEDAAQKRISRALEKLRAMLSARGASLSVPLLASLLASRAVSAAPAGLAVETGSKALAVAGGTGLLATLTILMTTWQLKLAVGLTAAGVAAGVLIYHFNSSPQPAPAKVQKVAEAAPAAAASPTAPLSAADNTSAPGAETAAPAMDALHLTILAADSGQPVPNVEIKCRGWENEHFTGKKFLSNRSGQCDVSFPRATITQLQLTSVADGFADTRLEWGPDRGETIPSSYTLRLTRPVRISGHVVDADGQPVVGAKVGWNCQEDGAADTHPENHNFGWIEVETDAQGGWEVNRIAPDVLRRIYGSPTHPEYVSPPLLMVSATPQVLPQLKDGTHIFHMGRAFSVSGTVVDPDGNPIADAAVRVGHVGEGGRREGRSSGQGTFAISGCRPGRDLITAAAPGFAATTVEVDVSASTPPITLQLQPGQPLRLRLVDKAGQPIPGANVWYNTLPRTHLVDVSPAPAAQVEFSPKTDAEGRAVWESAPKGELTFSFAKKGYMRQDDVKVDADGQEHVLTLAPALVVSGSVTDAHTGNPIPKFRIACGWPENVGLDGKMQPKFSDIERYWLSFAGGKYEHSFEETLIGGLPSNPGYVLKFEAEGYAPFVSRVFKEDEGEVKLDVTLEPAADLVVTVLGPDGQPAANVDVALIGPGRTFQLIPGGFSRQNMAAAGGLLTTDAQGQVKRPAGQRDPGRRRGRIGRLCPSSH